MQKFVVLYLLLFLTPLFSIAQATLGFKGRITDEWSHAVSGATVLLLNSGYSAITNEDGTFSIHNVRPGTYMANISRIGYATFNRQIDIGQETKDLELVLISTHKQLSEVIVTAQKSEEVLQKLPVSITSLSSKEIEDYRIWNMNDLTAIAPNLYTADPGDKRNVTAIRGIATTSYEPAVAVYIDGVNQFGLDTYIAQLYDVERIEIIRGPQGTLYGRNAMGGVINIITTPPANTTSGFAESSFANYGQQRLSAGIRTALVKDKLFLGAAGLYEHSNGYYKNEFNNSAYDKQQSITGNYYLKYYPGNAWSISANVKHMANRNNGAFPLVFGVEEAFENPFKLNQNAITKMVDNIFNGSVAIHHTGRKINFNTQTAYQSNYRFYTAPIDADFSPLDGITIINNYGKNWNNVNVLTQELRFSSPALLANPWKWSAGSYFFHQYSPVKQATRFGNDAMMLGLPDNNFSLINTTRSKATGLALYGQGTYMINEKLDLTAGIRYDYEHKDQSVRGEYQKDPNPNPQFAFRNDTSAKAHYNALSPKLSIAYHYAVNSTAFITYSKGFRAGGLTPLSSDPSLPPLHRYEPELSNNVEAGFKNTLFNKRLKLNASLFYTEVWDVQVPTLILPDAVTITKNTGKLNSKGAELEVDALIWKGLEMQYNFGYTHATYSSLKVSQNSTEIDLRGRRQIFTPDVTSMLGLQYSLKIGPKKNTSLYLRGEWKYLGTQYFDLANNIKQGSYSLINIRTGVMFHNFSVALWARNLTNKKYIHYAYDFGAVRLGNPKNAGITLSVKI